MLLNINVNGEVTSIAIDNNNAHTERQCVEFVTEHDALRIHNNDELLFINNRLFSLVTPFEYCIDIERADSVSNAYIFEVFNFKRSCDWLLYGQGYFRLHNVSVFIEDNDMMITISVPANAVVSLNDEEIRFREYAVINNEKVTNFE